MSEAVDHDGYTWALDGRTPPHVIKDAEDIGVSIQGEEALWSEVVRLRERLQGAVDMVRYLANGLEVLPDGFVRVIPEAISATGLHEARRLVDGQQA
jgi:hypothetical protein